MNKSNILVFSILLNLTSQAISKELTYIEVTELQRIARDDGIETSRELEYFLHLSPEEQEAYINETGPEGKVAKQAFDMKINAQKEAYREGMRQAKELNNSLRESYERQVREFDAGGMPGRNYNRDVYDESSLDY